MQLTQFIKVSRPGLWFPTLWLYFVPLGQRWPVGDLGFWVGLFWVTFPLNFLTYGWNDRVDAATDALNPRKDSFLFGARLGATELAALPRWLWRLGLASAVLLTLVAGLWVVPILLAMALCNWLYNDAWGGLRQRPPWELLAQVGYLLVVPLSAVLNRAPLPSLEVWLYLSLFAVQSHLIGEVMDVIPDSQAGRRTTATTLGRRGAKSLIIACVCLELLVVSLWIRDVPLAVMLAVALLWLAVDLFWVYGGRTYTLLEMRLAGVGSNVLGLLSAVYVWASGCLLR